VNKEIVSGLDVINYSFNTFSWSIIYFL